MLSEIEKILNNDELLKFIADGVYEYYKKQDDDSEFMDSLKKKLAEIEKSTSNIIKAIEAGIFNEATKNRMDELDTQRAEIKAELAAYERLQAWKLTRNQIFFFLQGMRNEDMSNPDCQKRLVNTFINAIYWYDDKFTITFNYSGDNRTVTFSDLDSLSSEGEEFVCRALRVTKKAPAYASAFFIFFNSAALNC